MPESPALCLHPRCHMMREHYPDECGWPAQVHTPSGPPPEPRTALE